MIVPSLTGPGRPVLYCCVFCFQIPLLDVRLLPPGTSFATTNTLRDFHVWSLIDGSCIHRLQGECPELHHEHELKLTAARISPDGNFLASVTEESQYVHLWNPRKDRGVQLTDSGSVPAIVDPPRCRISTLGFSPNGCYLAFSATDCTLRLWKIQKEDRSCSLVIDLHAPLVP